MVGVIVLASALAEGFASAQPSRGETVKIYAAAAVKTPLSHIIADFEKASGNRVAAVYDTAGATEQKFRADPDAALLITTAPHPERRKRRRAQGWNHRLPGRDGRGRCGASWDAEARCLDTRRN
jgi:hypothetical protein